MLLSLSKLKTYCIEYVGTLDFYTNLREIEIIKEFIEYVEQQEKKGQIKKKRKNRD